MFEMKDCFQKWDNSVKQLHGLFMTITFYILMIKQHKNINNRQGDIFTKIFIFF